MSETPEKYETKADANIGIFPELTPEQQLLVDAIKEKAFHAGYAQRQEELDAVANFPKKIIQELRNLPGVIQEEAFDLLQLTCDIEKNRKIIAELKADSMALISEVKESGKPKYSNSDMREAAVKALLKDSPEFCTSVDELARLEYQQRRAQISIEFYQNTFAACRSIALLLGVK